jgi:spoIIIJ-associated protein
MSEVSIDPGNFLQAVFERAQLDLRVEVYENESEYVLDLDGPDEELLQAQGGELLEAVQHLVNQACGRRQPKDRRIVCDVHGFRATREAELRAMAQHAAERVRSTGMEFMFGPMNANERRIIHLALADTADLQTESVGEGADRKLRVGLKKPAL